MGNVLQKIKDLFRSEARDPNYEPITHRLNPDPNLPQGMMEAIAPAYQEALAKEKEESSL